LEHRDQLPQQLPTLIREVGRSDWSRLVPTVVVLPDPTVDEPSNERARRAVLGSIVKNGSGDAESDSDDDQGSADGHLDHESVALASAAQHQAAMGIQKSGKGRIQLDHRAFIIIQSMQIGGTFFGEVGKVLTTK